MKQPGKEWLEFKIIEYRKKSLLQQIATFHPKGLHNRLYWYSDLSVHYFVFNGMAENFIEYN
jgi:hypothetical protein